MASYPDSRLTSVPRAPHGTCTWCGSGTATEAAVALRSRGELPSAFCWTKMQAEAGQPLQLILLRKELERTAGRGLFFWGIGTSVARKVLELLQLVTVPKVLFSVMKAKPKPRDVSPEAVFLWTAYIDLSGAKRALPEHALVLSRASTDGGFKTRHYALACYSDRGLRLQASGEIRLGHFRNLGSSSPRIGSSQVTAVIEHVPGSGGGPLYGVDLVADLAHPFFVQLADPVLLPQADRRFLDSVVPQLKDADEWTNLVRSLRQGSRLH
jgi:hypothetical protein